MPRKHCDAAKTPHIRQATSQRLPRADCSRHFERFNVTVEHAALPTVADALGSVTRDISCEPLSTAVRARTYGTWRNGSRYYSRPRLPLTLELKRLSLCPASIGNKFSRPPKVDSKAQRRRIRISTITTRLAPTTPMLSVLSVHPTARFTCRHGRQTTRLVLRQFDAPPSRRSSRRWKR